MEINLRKSKWLLFGGYNNDKSNIDIFLGNLGPILDKYMCKFENFILLGDFNSEMLEVSMKNFCEIYNLKNIVTGPTCFKNPLNPSSIDVILTNKSKSFLNNINVETGLSDFHRMTVSTMRTFFPKQAPIKIKYRSYKKFSQHDFNAELEYRLVKLEDTADYKDFETNFVEILNKHAPMKTKFVRANNSPFMSKVLIKAIMTRSRLRNKFIKNPNNSNKDNYRKQRNFCVNLLRKEKKSYYNNLNLNKITDNRKFWHTVKPFFSDKVTFKKSISLIEENIIISEDDMVANVFNDYFSNVVKRMQINEFKTEPVPEDTTDTIDSIIFKYKNHPSILNIKNNVQVKTAFDFSNSSLINIVDKINDLNINKPTTYNNIPAKILKENSELCSGFILKFYNKCIDECIFPNPLKMADITPTHKKDNKTEKENYRPVSILSSISKIFERLIYEDIDLYMSDMLSPFLCGFRKGYSTQNCLMVMLENMKTALDNRYLTGALLTDLSKAFDCINHELLIAKLESYGFSHVALTLILSYLSNRKQRTKINNSFSNWSEIVTGVPQGSILGPLLFNIYINDIFYFLDENKLTNYADDTTTYSTGIDIESLLHSIQLDSRILLLWFEDNYFKLNADKCKLLIANHEDEVSVKIQDETIICEKAVKLLGVTIDNKLNFNEHVSNLCKKASLKLHALSRISHLMKKDKLRTLMKAFIESQFSYCPLIWMFHSRYLNNKINSIHERALRLVYKDYNASFQELLDMDNSVSIHQRNLQTLAVEMFKIKNNFSPPIMSTIFRLNENPFNLRDNNILKPRKIRTVHYGTETVTFRGPEIWAQVPENIKNSSSVNEFKTKIKTWKTMGCKCRICKTYIPNLGFI